MATTEALISTEEKKKQEWLLQLADFIVEANLATWAGNGREVEPQRPGYKELEYPPQDIRGNIPKGFYLRDSYAGYFRAHGMTTIYYNKKPAWAMHYGGHGQTEGYEQQTNQTFEFLKSSLRQVSLELPFRGPTRFENSGKIYTFEMLEGNITDGKWREGITEDGQITFTQEGIIGIVIDKDQNGQPIMPWNIT